MAVRQSTDRGFKRSIDGIFSVFSNLKNQKAAEVQSVKSALYNVGVLVILAAFAGVFLVLLPFLNPLFWAFLFGAVLFPAKKKLAKAINLFIEELETTDTPIALGVVVFPFNGMMKVGEFITMFLIAHIKVIAFGLCAMLSLRISVHYVPSELIGTGLNVALWFHNFCATFIGALNLKIMLMLVAVHATAVLALWTPALSKVFTFFGQVLWILVAAFLCSFLGSLQIPAFILAMIYGAVGFSYDNELFGSFKKVLVKEPPSPKAPADETQFVHATPMGRLLKTRTHLSEIKQKMQLSFQQEARSQPAAAKKEVELESDTYFKILFYACTATVLWHQLWMIFMCFIPICCFAGKELLKALGLWNFIEDQWRNNYELKLRSWVEPRRDALFPVCWSGVVTLNSKLHKFSCEKLKSFVDDISSIVMILLLIVGVTFLGVFFFFQIYSETIAVAQLGSNLINRTLTLRPELVEMLPINMQSMNDVIDNAYKYSRGTIEDYLDSLFNQTNPEVASKLKQQILTVWDRLVQSYMDRNNEGVGPRVGVESVLTTLDEIVATSGVTYTGLFAWAKSNLGMLMELSDSLWIVLKANLSLLFSTFTTLFSVLVGSGHAMIKFLFNTIIFFTTLYYLLQSSRDRYAPIALNISSSWGSRLADALEDSVSSVLVATMKLSLFHGLFTWLTHTVFGAHVVYLPSILATILAAAPFLETYWCCIPAFLDLWLSQDRFYLGLTLVLIHFIVPSNFNPIVHSEIKGGGHPYLTALSIVGGMYLFGGVEGAILGPLLLCLLVVLSSITLSNLNSPSTLTRQSSLDESTSLMSPALDAADSTF